jgi:hypothetical protein
VSSKRGRIELVSSGSQVRLHSQPLLTKFLESGALRWLFSPTSSRAVICYRNRSRDPHPFRACADWLG